MLLNHGINKAEKIKIIKVHLSQNAPFWHMHLCLHDGPKKPLSQGVSHDSPCQPERHEHKPLYESQSASLWQEHSNRQPIPHLPVLHVL